MLQHALKLILKAPKYHRYVLFEIQKLLNQVSNIRIYLLAKLAILSLCYRTNVISSFIQCHMITEPKMW